MAPNSDNSDEKRPNSDNSDNSDEFAGLDSGKFTNSLIGLRICVMNKSTSMQGCQSGLFTDHFRFSVFFHFWLFS